MDAAPSLSATLNARIKYLTDRQGVLAGNIANADTPNYLPRDVSFAKYLQKAQGQGGSLKMAATSGKHLGGASGSSGAVDGDIVTTATFVQHNGNGVRLDDQLMKQNATELDYRYMTQIKAKLAGFQKLAIGRQP